MSLWFANPVALTALAALLVPVLLHLHRQSQPRRIAFAAWQWLSARQRPRQRWRLREWLLLCLRLLLVAVLALALAGPQLSGLPDRTSRVLLAPAVVLAEARATVAVPGARWQWLAPGFPPVDLKPGSNRPAPQQPLASLLREAASRWPDADSLTVIVPEQMSGLDGERIRLARPIQWRPIHGWPNQGQVVAGPAAPAVPSPANPLPALAIRHDPDHAAALPYLRAAVRAWQAADSGQRPAPAVAAAPADQPIPDNTRWLLWQVAGPMPATLTRWIEAGGIALLDVVAVLPDALSLQPVWRDDQGRVLARAAALGRGRVVQWQQPLTPEALPELLEPSFPAALRVLFTGPEPAPAQALATAVTPLADGPVLSAPARALQPWLWWAALLLFALERGLASSPARRRPA